MLTGCPYNLDPEVWEWAKRVMMSIEDGILPAAGGLCDQGEQWRQAREILLAARHEITTAIESEEKRRAELAAKRGR